MDDNILSITADNNNLHICLNGVELKNVIEYTVHDAADKIAELSVRLYITGINIQGV